MFCEKPLTDASESAERLAKHCRELNIPLMEAFVFRYHPQTRVVRTLIKEGRIGTVSQITGHMSFFFDRTQLSSNIRMDWTDTVTISILISATNMATISVNQR